jgi:hypothetical protein
MTTPSAPQVMILDTIFHGNNLNGTPVFSASSDGKPRVTLLGWTCFGPDEAGQTALATYASRIERADD